MMAGNPKYATFSIGVLLLLSVVFANAAHERRVDGLLVLGGEGRTVLAWSVNGLLSRSTDAGNHWTQLTGVAGEKLSDVTLERNRRSVLFAESGDLVYTSTDQGTTWHDLAPRIDAQKPLPPVDIHDPTFLYATLRDKIVYSTNGGDRWEVLAPNIPRADIYRMWIDPRNVQTLYAGALLHGIYRSTNGGATWDSISGIPFSGVYGLYFDPANPGTMYLETLAIYIESSEGDLYKSIDGGQNWTVIHFAVDFFAITPSEPPLLFVGAWTQRSHRDYFILFKSTDGGGGWTLANSGLPTNKRIRALVSSPTDHSNLYAASEGGAVFKSVDLGTSWRSTGLR
jgi:hypothetical protein